MTLSFSPNSLHAMIPAAGRSRRMGQPKLLMKIGQVTLIKRLLQQLQHTAISTVHLLVRSEDVELQQEIIRCSAEVVIPSVAPEQMRESVEQLLAHLEISHSPQGNDSWLLIPADHPVVLPTVLDTLVAAWQANPEAIIVPTYKNRRGHPTIFPWSIVPRLSTIPSGLGLNWLLKQKNVLIHEIQVAEPSILWDIDTPEDFQRISKILKD